MKPDAPHAEISVVVPVFNEAGNVTPLYERLAPALEATERSFEVLFVDDGSTDGTAAEIEAILARDCAVGLVRLKRNAGQTAALAAGLDAARGEVVVTLDGDGQNPPEEIPKLLARLEEGFDVVSGWRRVRRDAWLRRAASRCGNFAVRAVTGVRLHDFGCTLKAYRREAVAPLALYGDRHRFIPVLAQWSGARVTEVEVAHEPRRAGRSKYGGGLGRSLGVALDLLTLRFLLGYGTKPIRLFGALGLASGGAGALMLAWLAYLKFARGQGIGDRPMLMAGVLLAVLGVQFVSLGLLAEFVARIYHEAAHRRPYTLGRVERPAPRRGERTAEGRGT